MCLFICMTTVYENVDVSHYVSVNVWCLILCVFMCLLMFMRG